ncbi:MAG: hypothetical protein KDC38_09405, partial [Planctomycetes bacterium]|nr:hypothetical protein [Planctomycetota bacterium]
LDCLMVDSQPKDLIVDSDNACCYVSCAGDDTVVRVDLSGPTMAITHRFPIPGKRPTYLTLERNSTNPSLNTVLVSMNVSGNNTIVSHLKPSAAASAELRIWDGSDPSLFPNGGLPDEDIFRIDPTTNTVQPIVTGAGAVNYALAFNPVTQDLWSVGVDMHNASPSTEEDLKGQFATNMLSIVGAASLPGAGAPTVAPTNRIDIDGAPGSYSQLRSIPNPSSIVFDGGSGNGWISAATGPVIATFDSAGNRIGPGGDLYLTDLATINGTNCRTLVRLYGLLLAYCQDSGIIVVFDLVVPSQFPIGQLLLGHDPTPEPIRRGRALWNDAFFHSADGRFTCGTCHVGGDADGLSWDLSEKNTDEKGPMVTQTLLGIEDSAPYHWRGERTGADILMTGNPVTIADFAGAVEGLLGSPTPLSPTETLDLVEFIKSLRAPANPVQDLDRVIKDSLVAYDQNPDPLVTTIGDPTEGDLRYHDLNSDLEPFSTCTTCHAVPTGSNGDWFPDPLADQIAVRDNFEPTQLNQLTLKKQPTLDIAVNFQSNPTVRVPLLGAGTHHSGDIVDLFTFCRGFFFNGTTADDDQKAADITAFLDLFDSGTAPSVHHAVRLHAGNTSTGTPTPAMDEVKRLVKYTQLGWNGVIFFGNSTIGGVTQHRSWYYDTASSQFISDDGRTRTLAQVYVDHATGRADSVFLGVPPGNEFRLGVDPDNDGLTTGAELALVPPTDPMNPDSDGDSYSDGYEIANGGQPTVSTSLPVDTVAPSLVGGLQIEFVNASVLKVQFETDEPCTWRFNLSTGNGFAPVVDTRQTLDTRHTAVVHRLAPSVGTTRIQNYTGTLTITDQAGLATTINLPPNWFTTAPATSGSLVITGLGISNESRPTTTSWAGDVTVTLGDRLQSFPFPAPYAPVQSYPDTSTTPPIPAVTHPGYLVVGQLQKFVNDEWVPIPIGDIAITSSTALLVSTFKTLVPGQTQMFAPYTQIPGPWIISELTNASGATTVGLQASNVPAAVETVRYVPKIICEQPLDSPGVYTFVSDPILIGALSRTTDPAAPANGIFFGGGTHQLLHYGFPMTDPVNRKVKSSM